MNVIEQRIKADKRRIFNAHPRQIDIRYGGKWYKAIRVAAFSDGMDMTGDGYNPDTDTMFKVNYQEFVGANGDPVAAPKKNEEIRAESVNWRIQEVTKENDDLKLHCRKRLDTA